MLKRKMKVECQDASLHSMKTYRGVKVYIILMIGTDGGKWSGSRLGRSTRLGKCLRYPVQEEARWTPELVLTL